MQSSHLVRVGLATLAALLLCIGLLTNTGQAHAAANGTLTVNNTWTSAWGNYNTVASSFNRGNQIQYNVSVSNSSGSNMNIRLNFDARTASGGEQIEDFASAILSTPPGNYVWWVQDTVPQNASEDTYTLKADVWDTDNNSNAGSTSGQFSVNNGGHFQPSLDFSNSPTSDQSAQIKANLGHFATLAPGDLLDQTITAISNAEDALGCASAINDAQEVYVPGVKTTLLFLNTIGKPCGKTALEQIEQDLENWTTAGEVQLSSTIEPITKYIQNFIDSGAWDE